MSDLSSIRSMPVLFLGHGSPMNAIEENVFSQSPTPDHYWPLLYAIAVQDGGEPVSFLCEQIVYGSVSMRGVVIG